MDRSLSSYLIAPPQLNVFWTIERRLAIRMRLGEIGQCRIAVSSARARAWTAAPRPLMLFSYVRSAMDCKVPPHCAVMHRIITGLFTF